LLVNDFFLLNVDARIELWEDLERRGTNFQRNRGHSHLAARFFSLRSEARPQLLEFGDVCPIVLRDVRDRVPRFGQVLRRFPANSTHGNAFNLAPLGEIGKLWLGKVAGAGSASRGRRRRQQSFRVHLHVILTDAPAWPGTLYFIYVYADLARQPANVWR